MLYRALLRFFAKSREGKIHSNFDKRKLFIIIPRIHHKVVLLILRSVFAVGFFYFFIFYYYLFRTHKQLQYITFYNSLQVTVIVYKKRNK